MPVPGSSFPCVRRSGGLQQAFDHRLIALRLLQIDEHRDKLIAADARQRIAIARALIVKPQLIVLDEPTSSLDKTVQAQILKLLKALQRKHQLAYIFISHDLGVVRALCHQVMVLRQGMVVEQGECQSVFSAPRHEYTRQLLAAAE